MIKMIEDVQNELMGLGCLFEQNPEIPSNKRVLPLSGVHIQGSVLAGVAHISLRQSYLNTYENPIEAIYTFPLPGDAAVSSFELKVGDRSVRGQVEERKAARKAYQQALDNGNRAALMEKERDDVYTMQVGNIPPGEQVEVELEFVQRLDFREEGLYELRLPMVIAPRYIPGEINGNQSGLGVEMDTDAVPDASRISPPRLAPGFDPEVDLSIEIELQKISNLQALSCTQHANQISLNNGNFKIALAKAERLNRDFVLRWRSEAELTPRAYYMAGPEGTGFGLIQFSAPAPAALIQQSRDVVFLLDRSGSMGEYKMNAAAQACGRLLESLGPRDRFAIQAFDHDQEWLQAGQVWLPADEQGKKIGQRFLRKIEARGGTELLASILEAQKKLEQDSENLPIFILLTDGQVGDESRILKQIQQGLKAAIIHCVGIDTAVNDSFLKRLARLAGGTQISVNPHENLNTVLDGIASEIGFPALENIKIKLPGLTPKPVPNLFYGRSLSLFFNGKAPENIRFHAEQDGERQDYELRCEAVDYPALAQLWAHSRIQSLEDRFRLEKGKGRDQCKDDIIAISTEHQVLSRFTAWLAIDKESEIENPEARQSIVQAVEMPDSWSHQMPVAACAPPPPGGIAFAAAAPAADDLADFSGGAADDLLLAEEAIDLYVIPDIAKEDSPNKMSSRSAQFRMMDTGSPKPPAAPLSPAQPAPKARSAKQARQKQGGGLNRLMNKVFGQKSSAAEIHIEPMEKLNFSAIAELQQHFINLLQKIMLQLKEQGSSDWQELEKRRESLLKQLENAPEAEHLPALQRLLRQDSLYLLQALKADQQQGLQALVKRLERSLALAEKEWQNLGPINTQDVKTEKSEEVWEQSI